MGRFLLGVLCTLIVLFSAVVYWVGSGEFEVAASAPNPPKVDLILYNLRERALLRRLDNIEVPGDMSAPGRLVRGAKLYDELCANCHLTPKDTDSITRRALNPTPMDLCQNIGERGIPRQFWVIKHGLKTTAMPAFGKGGLKDEQIWDVVAFVQKLPAMSETAYAHMVAAGKGKPLTGLQEYGGLPFQGVVPVK